ncbi:MAG: hypothetical protein EZS28_017014 [Streblomastix strix]|uniref:Uncharacterized protein n=1 Tax=Streblomastix strix TaxID=222440 RepID=A0A5J4VYH7_9EUKA|nr:MAG: hypothetical protein EZS28_017014 [Streblomastix strix]
MKELIQKHWDGHKKVLYKNDGENNMCYMEALARALNHDSINKIGHSPLKEPKRIKSNSIISISRQYLVKEEIDGKLAQHAFAIANKEALTGLKFLSILQVKRV